MFEKIVVGLDGSDPSERAMRVACELAEKFSARIILVHTPQPQTVAFALGATMGYHAVTTMPTEGEVKQAADKIMNAGKAIAAENGIEIVETHANRGDPAEQIVKCAERAGADLIITGRRGLGNLQALVQGSTTQRIGKLSKCSCLSVV
ncbi:universal stress protein [Ruegeria sp. 2012CJ41-6]|uniref:Universal stress protein n=1 Tax=Ruegeria spongiae TaxID=2942209 RepID=A0ABT0PZE2_9RHOB|nr:universal stress protein [Ruegeria spongiae]MCL6283000.1 universal stress protein [Ruegeria spongiae]